MSQLQDQGIHLAYNIRTRSNQKNLADIPLSHLHFDQKKQAWLIKGTFSDKDINIASIDNLESLAHAKENEPQRKILKDLEGTIISLT